MCEQKVSISNFNEENGIFEMPSARFIGVAYNHMPGKEARKDFREFLGNLFKSDIWNDVIKNLPNIINDELCDFTCEYVQETDSFTFIAGVFTPEGTPVPKGLEYRDVLATKVLISKKEPGKDALDELLNNGKYVVNYDVQSFPWQAFLRADTYSINPIKIKED